MDRDQPSRTALAAAVARAAHLIVDQDPPIFADVLALPMIGDVAETELGLHLAHRDHPLLSGTRSLVTVRSRYAEDALAGSLGRGIGQYVVLGAGLDTFGYRCDLGARLRVFEVDHPATQRWKRELLSAAAITVPGTVTFVPVDFETESVAVRLAEAGFRTHEPALVSWLGVTMYLTRVAIGQTLAELGAMAPGTELVANYALPANLRDAAASAYVDLVMPAAAERGEPWLSFLSPDEMTAMLKVYGFGAVRHIGQREAIDPVLWDRSDSLRPLNSSSLVHATIV